jgi:hypothetical protein
MGEGPTMKVNSLNLAAIDQNKLWVNYDAEADSIVIYLTGAPTRAVSVCFGDDIYLKVNPLTNDIVGLHIEAWERKFVPAHPDIQAVWDKVKPHAKPEASWHQLLRMLALWLIFGLKEDHRVLSLPQPV